MVEFEWNEAKSKINEKKHGVSFEEAQSVFYDEFARQFFDERHSGTEDRFILLGMSQQSRILVVCHCEQKNTEEKIRIISARKATKYERSFYRSIDKWKRNTIFQA